MDLKTYCSGYLKISLKTSSLDRFLNMCKHHGFTLWELKEKDGNEEDTYELCMRACDFGKLTIICKKSHSRIHILKKKGLPFLLKRIKARKAFTFGLLFCAFLIVFLSQFIWKIQVSGNQYYDTKTLLRYLYQNEIQSGLLKRNCSCSEISESLRAAFPNIVWVSTKMAGSCLEIQIKENLLLDSKEEQKKEKEEDEKQGWAIKADCDGTIVSMITQTGIPMFGVGSTCKEGDILVSGQIPIINDSLEVVGYQFVKAQADIQIETIYPYYDEFSLKYQKKIYQEEKESYCLLIGDFLMDLSHFSSDGRYDLSSERQPIVTLNEFPFPITLYRLRQLYFTSKEETYTSKEAKSLAEKHLQQYLLEKEKLGVQILKNSVKIRLRGSKCIVSGNLWVRKKAGVLVPEKTEDESELQNESQNELQNDDLQ